MIFQRPDCLADLLSGHRLCLACCPYPNFLGRILSLILTNNLAHILSWDAKKTFSVWSWSRQVTLAHHFFLNPSSELRNATLKLVLILIHTSQLSLTVNYFLLTSDIIQNNFHACNSSPNCIFCSDLHLCALPHHHLPVLPPVREGDLRPALHHLRHRQDHPLCSRQQPRAASESSFKQGCTIIIIIMIQKNYWNRSSQLWK